MNLKGHEIPSRAATWTAAKAGNRTPCHVQRHLDAVVLGQNLRSSRLHDAPRRQYSGWTTAKAPDLNSGINDSFSVHVSPVPKGTVVDCAKRTHWSSSAMESHLPSMPIELLETGASLMQSSTGICPKWSMAIGISYPVAARHRPCIAPGSRVPFPSGEFRERDVPYEQVVCDATHRPWVDRAMRRRKHSLLYSCIVFRIPPERTTWPRRSSGVNPQIHLQECVALAPSLASARAISRPLPWLSVSQINTDSCHGTYHQASADRHPPSLAANQQATQRTNAAGLTGRTAKLLDSAGIIFSTLPGFSPRIMDSAWRKVLWTRHAPRNTQSNLVRIYFHQRATLRRTVDVRKPDVGNLQIIWINRILFLYLLCRDSDEKPFPAPIRFTSGRLDLLSHSFFFKSFNLARVASTSSCPPFGETQLQ